MYNIKLNISFINKQIGHNSYNLDLLIYNIYFIYYIQKKKRKSNIKTIFNITTLLIYF